MIVRIKPQHSACIFIACATIGLLPTTGLAKSKSIIPTDLLQTLLPGEPWDRGVFASTKMVMFQQVASGGTDATTVSKITLSYFTSTDCSGAGQGIDTGSSPNPSYTTPNGTSFTINTTSPFGMVAASAWNVGNAKLGISNANMANIKSIAVTLKSTNNNTPQTDFSGSSFACLPVTCTAGPSGQCASGSGTQSFQLKTAAAIGDPADGGVIACMDVSSHLVVPSSDNSANIAWAPGGSFTATNALSDTDGATNTATIVTTIGAGTIMPPIFRTTKI